MSRPAGDAQTVKMLIIHAFSPKNLGDGAITQAMITEARRVFGDSVQTRISATEPDAFLKHGIPATGRLLPQRAVGRRGDRFRWLLRNLPTIVLVWWASGAGRARLDRASRLRVIPQTTRVAIAGYLWADVIVAAGGGYLGDSYRRALPFWHLEFRCVRASGRPLVMFSQSISSAEHRSTRYFLRRILDIAALFIARDRQTVERIAGLGPYERKAALCADAALILGPVTRIRSEEGAVAVGVSMVRWDHYSRDAEEQHHQYMAGMEEALKRLLASDQSVHLRFYPTNAAHKTNPMNDSAVLEAMLSRLEAAGFGHRCMIVPWTGDPSAFMVDVSQCELFIATRLHSAILASDAGVPAAAIAYQDKTRGTLALLGLGSYVADIERPWEFSDLVSRAFSHRDEMRAILLENHPIARASAQRAMELVAEVACGGAVADNGTGPAT